MKTIYILIILFFAQFYSFAQSSDSLRLAKIETMIHEVSLVDKRFSSDVDISVGKISLSELLRNVAKTTGVNLSVRGGETIMVTCNFSNSKVTDLLYFLCKEHEMDIDVIGNIVSIFPVAKPMSTVPEPNVDYTLSKKSMSYDLHNDKLIDVSIKIGELTGINVIIPHTLYEKSVSGHVNHMPIDDAINTLAEINDLRSIKNKQGVWTFFQEDPNQNGNIPTFRRSISFAEDQLSIDSLGLITARINRGNVGDIITDLCERQKLNYFFISPVNTESGIYVKDVTLETLLDVILTGTEFSYYIDKNIYFFGKSSKEKELHSVQIIPFNYRSVNKIDAIIPISLKAGLQISQFADLNSLVICGNKSQISRIVSFIESIDKPVPLITIDIIIVDSRKNNNMEAGVGMGIGKAPVQTSGTISPGIDLTLSATTVNKLINSFNGFGSTNIGRVTPEFYMSLKLLEENGNIELQSTPKLSTLNGHEASLKSGETRYYKEVLNSYIGTQNPIQSESFTWKSIEANLNIKITPYVSVDSSITMEIEIEQSEFTEKESADAPPGTATRSFKSLIKVQNEDMVLLGGIDRNRSEKSSSGLPFISRIPVLKWIFGQSKDSKSEHKLNVFIKPTVIQ